MEVYKLKSFLSSLSSDIDQKNIDLYLKLIDGKRFEKIEDYEDFYYALIYPHDQFLSGLINSEISKDNNVEFILKESQMIQQNFEFWIKKYEGYGCCADKSRTIVRYLIDFFKRGERIEFDYTQEYTFHLPKVVFKTHESIIAFYDGLLHLTCNGNPEKYMIAIKELVESAAVELETIKQLEILKQNEQNNL